MVPLSFHIKTTIIFPDYTTQKKHHHTTQSPSTIPSLLEGHTTPRHESDDPASCVPSSTRPAPVIPSGRAELASYDGPGPRSPCAPSSQPPLKK